MENWAQVIKLTFSQNVEEQRKAEIELVRLSKLNGYALGLFKVVVDQNVPVEIQQSASIHLKNHCRTSKDDFSMIQSNLVEAITRAHPSVRSQLGVLLHDFAEIHFPKNFKDLLPTICKYFQSNDIQKIYGALYSLRFLVKAFSYSPESTKDQNNMIISTTFPILKELGKYLTTKNTPEFAEMQKLIAKCFWGAIQSLSNIADHFREQGNFDAWVELCIVILQLPVPKEANATSAYWKAKKWVVHIIYRIFIAYQVPELCRDDYSKGLSKHFTSKYSVPLLKVFLGILENNQKGDFVPDRILTLSVYFLNACIGTEDCWKLILSSLEYFFHRIIFPFLCFDQNDANLWKNDPEEYIRNAFNTTDTNDYDKRIASANLLLELVNKRKDSVTPILGWLFKLLKSDQNNVREGALHGIGIIRKTIIKELGDKTESLLINMVVPELSNQKAPFLRSRACWTIGKFVSMKWNDINNFKLSLQKVLNCMQDSELPVKVEASVCLAVMIKRDLCNKELSEILPKIFVSYLELMNKIDNDHLVYALDVIVKTFGEKVEPFAASLCEKLCLQVMEQLEELEEDPDMNGGVIFETIRVLQSILTQMSTRKQFLNQIEPKILPALQKILESESLDFLEEGMRLFTIMTYNCQVITPNLWVVFNLIFKAFNEWAYDYVDCFVAPLDNIISRDPDTFVKNPENVSQVYQFMKKIYDHKGDQEEANFYAVSKLISVIFQYCRGKFDQYYVSFVHLLLGRLTKAPPALEQILIFNAIADAISYNPVQLISILESQQCTMSVFSLWFKIIPKCTRLVDLKIQIIGLTNLLNGDMSKYPNVLKQNLHQIIKRIISLIQKTEERKQAIEEWKKEWQEKEKDYLERKARGEIDSEDEEDEEDQDFDGLDMDSILGEMDRINKLEQHGGNQGQGQQNDDDLDQEEGDYGQAEEEEDELDEEEESFTNAWDDVNENTHFADTLKKLQKSNQTAFNSLMNTMNDIEKNVIKNLMK